MTYIVTPSWRAAESSPKANLAAAAQKSGRPLMGKYSWFREASWAISFSILETTDKTHGSASSVRYAPTPRLIFFGFESALKNWYYFLCNYDSYFMTSPIVRRQFENGDWWGQWNIRKNRHFQNFFLPPELSKKQFPQIFYNYILLNINLM